MSHQSGLSAQIRQAKKQLDAIPNSVRRSLSMPIVKKRPTPEERRLRTILKMRDAEIIELNRQNSILRHRSIDELIEEKIRDIVRAEIDAHRADEHGSHWGR